MTNRVLATGAAAIVVQGGYATDGAVADRGALISKSLGSLS